MTAVSVLFALQVSTSPVPRQMSDVGFLVGDWVGSAGGATVRLEVSRGPSGRSLSYLLSVSARVIKSFSDQGFIWWDREAAAYRSFAMSSLSNEPRREIGRIDQGALVMVSEPFEVDGRSERTRRSFTKDGAGIKCDIALRDGEAWKSKLSVRLAKRSK